MVVYKNTIFIKFCVCCEANNPAFDTANESNKPGMYMHLIGQYSALPDDVMVYYTVIKAEAVLYDRE